jgi:hypothetical protein
MPRLSASVAVDRCVSDLASIVPNSIGIDNGMKQKEKCEELMGAYLLGFVIFCFRFVRLLT